MDQLDRTFTPEEANQTLELIRPMLEQLRQLRDQIISIQPELAAGLQKAVENGGSNATGQLMRLMQRLRQLVDQIQSHGVLVKDIDQGLLDFPAKIDGRLVFLCWKHGEESVAYWHDLDAGFAGRQPL